MLGARSRYLPVLLALLFPFSLASASDDVLRSNAGEECVATGFSQPEAPQQRRRGDRGGAGLYRNRVSPNWIEESDKFWYRNDLPQGGREFILVDAAEGKRERAFDHDAVAAALQELLSKSAGESAGEVQVESSVESSVKGIRSTHLPIDRLEFSTTDKQVRLITEEKMYLWDAASQALTELDADAVAALESGQSAGENARNSGSGNRRIAGDESSVAFENRSKESVELFWLSGDGSKTSYGKVEPGASREQHTFGGHMWQIVNAKGDSLGEVTAQDTHSTIVIDGTPIKSPPPTRRRTTAPRNGDRDTLSPDGKWIALIEAHNVVAKQVDSEERRVLSQDGTESHPYVLPTWSPDSGTLVAFRQKLVEAASVNWIRSSPPGGGRALLETRPYVLPGDPFPTYEVNLFHVESGAQIKPDVEPYEHEWQRPRVRFHRDGTKFTYEQIDRGHQRFRLIEIDLQAGEVRSIIDEKTETYIWTAHTENQNLSIVQWLNDSDEILYATEKNGWRQLILVDAASGSEKQILTPTGIVVRSVESIDEPNRQVWFTACGREGQDPYLIHHGYVSLDTGKLTWVTAGDGNHTLEFSPRRDYVIDTYSRVDLAPVTELRRVADGEKVCDLETSDISQLTAGGWAPPEVFVAKGRDADTDIWGIICRPKNFDPNKKYPVIEDIYAGPQSSYVPKSFSPGARYESLTELGFIVVKMDGMGTANRSKAFHDVCWKNLKDGGFEDRIAWMKAAAEKYPELDLTRVGIYGTSAGGQNAAAAVLFHPEFYKVAVAACGCHDNRMDKASWNEQWMGYPVGPHYAACSNIDNAHRLQGKLFLIVGEMDTNVPPESTLRLADALIRADKDFDLLVVPNGGHGMGGSYGQRRMHDYFVTHLLTTAERQATATTQ